MKFGRLTGRHLSATGAIRGIGLTISARVCHKDARVAALDKDLSTVPSDVCVLHFDLCGVRTAEIAVGAAAVFAPVAAAKHLPIAECESAVKFSHSGPLPICRGAIRVMRRSGGRAILNFGSTFATLASPMAAAYLPPRTGCVSSPGRLLSTAHRTAFGSTSFHRVAPVRNG